MVTTAPYDASLEERLRHEIQHLYKVRCVPAGAAEFELPVDGDLSIAFSLGWSPYAQASATIKAPTKAAERAALDGRLRTFVGLDLGYALDGGTPDLHGAAFIRLDDVSEDVTGHRLRISMQGREMEAQDAIWYSDFNTTVPRTGVREFIEYVLKQTFLTGVTVTLTGTANGYRPDLVANVNPSTGQSLWSIASNVANSAGLKLWHDGLGTWHLRPRYSLTGDYATMLRTGKSGTVTTATRKLARTDWYNRVELTFPDVGIRGSASTPSSSPFHYTKVGAKTYTADIPGWANQGSADAHAASLLSTFAARGNAYTIQAAAAYWIRPGMTVPVKTGLGPYEKQLVESVTFTPLNGLMSVETIKNEDAA